MAEKEYIERGAVANVLNRIKHNLSLSTQTGVNIALASINADVPAADVVEVRRGAWEITKKVLTSSNPYIDDDYYIRVECSECGFRVQETRGGYGYAKPITTNYCPNCGAYMDGKGEGE